MCLHLFLLSQQHRHVSPWEGAAWSPGPGVWGRWGAAPGRAQLPTQERPGRPACSLGTCALNGRSGRRHLAGKKAPPPPQSLFAVNPSLTRQPRMTRALPPPTALSINAPAAAMSGRRLPAQLPAHSPQGGAARPEGPGLCQARGSRALPGPRVPAALPPGEEGPQGRPGPWEQGGVPASSSHAGAVVCSCPGCSGQQVMPCPAAPPMSPRGIADRQAAPLMRTNGCERPTPNEKGHQLSHV